MHTYFGNSARSSGYSCLMEKLVSSWRTQWSANAGTTDPNAPFGLVTLAPSGSEGGAVTTLPSQQSMHDDHDTVVGSDASHHAIMLFM